MGRAKNLGLAARDSADLTQDTVQQVIDYIADGKNQNANRLQSNTIHNNSNREACQPNLLAPGMHRAGTITVTGGGSH